MSNKKNDRLIYCALGGAGEIGMNMYLYGYGAIGKERFVMVDMGVAFPDMDTTPGVELILPDPSFVIKNKIKLEGIFITHAHEDHIGALGHLLEKFKAPVYCRKFTAAIGNKKIENNSHLTKRIKVTAAFPKLIQAGPFEIGFLPLSHSIPEASALLIKTPIGALIHTGDLKIDRTPVLGEPFNDKLLQSLGKKGVLALACDSTNVFNNWSGRSESTLKSSLKDLMLKSRGMIVATTFASNLARVLTLAQCAEETGRSILVLGRAMQTMLHTATAVNILECFPKTISASEAKNIQREKLLVLATGSQGESRAASANLARDSYMDIEMKQGDTFLFSSKTIPGNEKAVSKIVNMLVSRGVEVIDDDNSGKYHVSGHANRPDLEFIHDILKPKLVIPIHGEIRHLREHEAISESKGIKSILAENGDMVEIDANGMAKIVDEVEVGRLYLDSNNLIKSTDGIVRTRLQLATRGHISVSLLIENNKILPEGVWVKSKGIFVSDNEPTELESLIEDYIEEEFIKSKSVIFYDDEEIEQRCQRIINRVCKKELNKKPVTTIFVNRLEV